MKLSLAIAPSHASPLAFVVFRDSYETSMAKANRLGYDGVELALASADEVDPAQLKDLLSRFSLELPVISTGRVFGEAKLFLTDPDAGRRRQAVERVKGLIDLAARFGAMVNLGRVRGYIAEGETAAIAAERFGESLRECAGYAKPLGVTLIVEPVNRYEINFINSLDEGAALLDALNLANTGLMPDVFHMNIEDDRIGASLIRNSRWVRYIHLADSNRMAPGQGHLDFGEIFGAMKSIGYNGWVTVEILQRPDPDTAARQAAEFLRPKIAAYNESF
jgi:sugar phosphate isomerase/epimerase